MQREPLKDRAVGRWHGILPSLGIPSKALTNRHGPCPMCGGKDRFRFDDKGGRGTWFCSNCGAGDGIELVKRFQNCEFPDAARLIEQHIGTAPVIGTGKRQAPTDGQKRQEMIDLWNRSRPITPDDHAGRYLHARTGLSEFPPCLRYSPDERYAEAWLETVLAPGDGGEGRSLGQGRCRWRAGGTASHLSRPVRRQGGRCFAAQDDGLDADRRGGATDAARGCAWALRKASRRRCRPRSCSTSRAGRR